MSDLTTYAKVKQFLGISSAGDNSVFAVLVKSVSAEIETYCNREFTETTYTEYIDTDSGQKKVFLKNFPVASITTLKYRQGTFGNPQWFSFPSDDYMLSGSMGKITFSGSLPEAEKFIEAIYVGGYKIDFDNESNSSLHTLPADITQVATEWAAKVYNNRKNAGIASESTEGQSITFKADKIPEEFKDRLAPYKSYNA